MTEQEKIAACLSSIDEIIALETRKLDLLTRHKRKLMQLLLPQEMWPGVYAPAKLRFPQYTHGVSNDPGKKPT